MEQKIVEQFRAMCEKSINPDLYSTLVDGIIPALKLAKYYNALDRRVRLGNGTELGNSEGNIIAQQALETLEEVIKTPTQEIQYLGQMLTASTADDKERVISIINRLVEMVSCGDVKETPTIDKTREKH